MVPGVQIRPGGRLGVALHGGADGGLSPAAAAGIHPTSSSNAHTVPLAFTASETFDVGIDLGASVSEAYAKRRPFPFNGTIHTVKVAMGGASDTGLREP